MGLSNAFLTLAGLALPAWAYLLPGRRGFWRARPRLENQQDPPPAVWPAVVAVVPARNEAETVETALRSLLGQDYGGTLTVVLVHDQSLDPTRSIAARPAAGAARPLAVIEALALPPGWVGQALGGGRRLGLAGIR